MNSGKYSEKKLERKVEYEGKTEEERKIDVYY